MRCPSCGSDNPGGAKFCIDCAAPLQKRCPSCGADNLPRAKFCGECAAPLTVQAVVPQTSASNPQTLASLRPEAERRQLTVLFCDLVGSTALSEQLDPEELRELVRAYQETCATVIRRFEGYIAQYLGDGLLVYFGYPLAHEDDAARAVRAGLGIIEALRDLPTPAPHPLHVRISIHTGLVVVGEMGGGERQEQLALGETPNVAARLQGLATPDTVVLSAATHRLIQGLFECRELGPQVVKGLSTPLTVYQVLGEGAAQSRFEAAVRTGLTPLVERLQQAGVKAFWEREFPTIGEKAINPVINKLADFLLPGSMMERVFSEPDNELNFFEIMQKKKILLVRLAKGRFGEQPARLLGSVIVRGVQEAALARERIAREERHPFYLVVDEFQNFATGPFESILSETRKYNVYLTLAHQLLHQVPTGISKHVFGIVPMMISFRISDDDAKQMQRVMHKQVLMFREKGDVKFRPHVQLIAEAILKKEEWIKEMRQRQQKGETDILGRPTDAVIRDVQARIQGLMDHNPNELIPNELLHYSRDRYEFKYEEWPTPQDFVNLQNHECFVRWQQASNIWKVPTYRAPDPDPRIRGMARARARERFADRMEARKNQPPPPPPKPEASQQNSHAHSKPGSKRGSQRSQTSHPTPPSNNSPHDPNDPSSFWHKP
jgi:class 3 adenylate cyclase